MAVSHLLLPEEETASVDQTEPSSEESPFSSPTAGVEGVSALPDEDQIDEDEASLEQAAMAATKRPHSSSSSHSPARRSSSPICRKRFCSTRSQLHRDDAASDARLLSRLSRQLASLRALIPLTARSGKDENLIADALRYKKALSNEVEALHRCFPYAKQVSLQRIGSGGLQIKVSCEKRAGLLVALMEAIESPGIILSTVDVSCQDGKIRINASSTNASNRQTASLKVILMATIMRFSSQS